MALNTELANADVKGELCLYGGAVMTLVFHARPNTKDVDAVFVPSSEMREAAKRVAMKMGLREDWLNDVVKGFVVPHGKRILFDWPSLKVYSPDPEYLLAMKALAARVDATDREDVRLLAQQLKLERAEDVFALLEKYYPKAVIKPATQFFIEELFGT